MPKIRVKVYKSENIYFCFFRFFWF